MQLSKDEIEHISKLARLELTDAELEMYSQQLPAILNFVGELQEVNTDKVEPTAQVTGLANIYREDTVKEWDKKEVEEALTQAPAVEGRQVKVKRILE